MHIWLRVTSCSWIGCGYMTPSESGEMRRVSSAAPGPLSGWGLFLDESGTVWQFAINLSFTWCRWHWAFLGWSQLEALRALLPKNMRYSSKMWGAEQSKCRERNSLLSLKPITNSCLRLEKTVFSFYSVFGLNSTQLSSGAKHSASYYFSAVWCFKDK